MAEFLLIYNGGDPNWRNRPAADIEAAMQAWGQWFKQLETTGNLRNPGAPLVADGMVLRKKGARLETDMAAAEVKELIGGYTIIAADSLQHAAELAKGSPFLQNNPNGSVLVQPILQRG